MAESSRRRHPANGGYACGDETRRKLIDAAIHLFGERGYAGASTRDIAARAGMNAPALRYYFENKKGLYRACADILVNEALQILQPALFEAQQALENNGAQQQYIDAFINLQCATADVMFQMRHETSRWHFLTREQRGGEPEDCSRASHYRLREPVIKVSNELLARIIGRSGGDSVTVVRMFSLLGQYLAFHIHRDSMVSKLGYVAIDAKDVEYLKKIVSEQTRLLLEVWGREHRAVGSCALPL